MFSALSTEKRTIEQINSFKGKVIIKAVAFACLAMGLLSLIAPQIAVIFMNSGPFYKESYTYNESQRGEMARLGAYLVIVGAFAMNAVPTKNTLRCVGAAFLINGGMCFLNPDPTLVPCCYLQGLYASCLSFFLSCSYAPSLYISLFCLSFAFTTNSHARLHGILVQRRLPRHLLCGLSARPGPSWPLSPAVALPVRQQGPEGQVGRNKKKRKGRERTASF